MLIKKVICIIFLCILTVPALAQPNNPGTKETTKKEYDQLLTSAHELEKNWRQTEKEFHHQFQLLLERVEKHLSKLENMTDGGDTALRQQINEHLSDLRRLRDRTKQKFDELSAATAVKLINIEGEVQDVIEDIKD